MATDMVSATEAAKRLGVTKQRVNYLITNNRLKSVKIGSGRCVKVSDVDRFKRAAAGRPKSGKAKP
jgi:excisionase family DNA binding protein